MSQPDIVRPEGMPKYIATGLEIALETGLLEDRLPVLGAANHFDIVNGLTEGLGAQVVTVFMKQRGIEFNTRGRLQKHSQWRKNLETPQTARITAQIAQAIGRTIGVETQIHELLDGPSRTVAVTNPGRDRQQQISLLRSDETDTMEIDPSKPYIIYQRCLRGSSFNNFHRAMFALDDDPEPQYPIIMPA